jgi:hypothetical protein
MHIYSGLLAPLAREALYLDPGSGSFLVQLLLAALLGGAFAVKIYWRKIKAFVTGKKIEEAADSPEAETPEPPTEDKPNDQP